MLLFTGFVSFQLGRDAKVDPATLVYPAVAVAVFFGLSFFLRWRLPNADGLILPLAAAMTFMGMIVIGRLDEGKADKVSGVVTHGYDLLRAQLVWLVVASIAFLLVVILFREYEVLAHYKYTIGIFSILILLVPMFIGKEVNGARLWIELGPMSFQPSEIAKILLVLFLAAFFAEKHELLSITTHRLAGIPVPEIKYFIPLLAMWGVSVLMMIFQKDLGSSLLFFGIFMTMLFAATARKSYVVVGSTLFLVGASVCNQVFSHVNLRVTTWLNPLDPATIEKGSYQISQSLFALASGGISGSGLGSGHPDFIPSVPTDFIFSAIGEEVGMLGAMAVIIMFVLLVERGVRIALRHRDDFGKLLAFGLTSIVALQAFIIMGGVTRLIPLTGITLPFISYGGSSLLANFMILALLMILSQKTVATNTTGIKAGAR